VCPVYPAGCGQQSGSARRRPRYGHAWSMRRPVLIGVVPLPRRPTGRFGGWQNGADPAVPVASVGGVPNPSPFALADRRGNRLGARRRCLARPPIPPLAATLTSSPVAISLLEAAPGCRGCCSGWPAGYWPTGRRGGHCCRRPTAAVCRGGGAGGARRGAGGHRPRCSSPGVFALGHRGHGREQRLPGVRTRTGSGTFARVRQRHARHRPHRRRRLRRAGPGRAAVRLAGLGAARSGRGHLRGGRPVRTQPARAQPARAQPAAPPGRPAGVSRAAWRGVSPGRRWSGCGWMAADPVVRVLALATSCWAMSTYATVGILVLFARDALHLPTSAYGLLCSRCPRWAPSPRRGRPGTDAPAGAAPQCAVGRGRRGRSPGRVSR